jgi:hypothetical protein
MRHPWLTKVGRIMPTKSKEHENHYVYDPESGILYSREGPQTPIEKVMHKISKGKKPTDHYLDILASRDWVWIITIHNVATIHAKTLKDVDKFLKSSPFRSYLKKQDEVSLLMGTLDGKVKLELPTKEDVEKYLTGGAQPTKSRGLRRFKDFLK